MKTLNPFPLMFTFLLLNGGTALVASAQISAGYPGDINIQNDPNVLFSEMFEENMTQMQSNWDDVSPLAANILFDASVPAGSPGIQSCRLITVNDNNPMNAGPGESTYLFNRMPGISDSVFVRYYIKYDNTSSFHHSGVWMGGNNPPTNWPNVHAGYRPAGDSAFHIGTEVRGTTTSPANSSVFGFYNYWTGMHISTQINPNTGTPYYWGNQFLSSDPNAVIDMSSWNCIEVMVKLNNPVSGTSGELALWINGNKIAHYGAGFPNGTWNQDFTEGAGAPFDGFQWRTDAALQFNYLWLTSYVTNNALNHVANVYYDHVVVAKNYIGPIAAGSLALNEEKNIAFSAFPNPADQTLHFSKELEGVKITNAIGQIIYQSDDKTTTISTGDFKAGMYFLSSSLGNLKFNVNR